VCFECAPYPTTEVALKSCTIKTNESGAIQQMEIDGFCVDHLLGGRLPIEIGVNPVENRLAGGRPPFKKNLVPLYPNPPAKKSSQ
jgi:hypothetical protein